MADSQGFHQFMASDLEHEDVVETAVWGPENNLIITGSRDALIQVRVDSGSQPQNAGFLTEAKYIPHRPQMNSDPDRGA